MAGSTISSTVTTQVALGIGVTLSPLTIATTGDIDYAGSYAVLVGTAYDGTIVNDGSVIGRGIGVYADGYAVTIFNRGTIHGGQTGIVLNSTAGGPSVVINSAAVSGIVGISGGGVSIDNVGVVDGVYFGIRVHGSTIVNSGTVSGETAVYSDQGILTNEGAIEGSLTGLYNHDGIATNFGLISGRLGAQIAGGSLANHGTISGGVFVAGGSLGNAGLITGATGVTLELGAAATNSGTINGQTYGVQITGANAATVSLVNSGSIYGQNDGITISGGYLLNSGRVVGGNIGVTVSGGLVVNTAVISSQNQGAVLAGGSLSNSGTIYGQSEGVAVSGAILSNFGSISGGVAGVALVLGSLANYGRISGGFYGVSESGGSVGNYGVVSSSTYGIMVSHGMVTNAGTIAGGKDAVYGSFITLGVEPGAVFMGDVVNNNGRGVLDLEGSGLGTLSGIGTQIQGFGNITFGSNANWEISGDATGLAGGVPITGMARTDTIVLDGFTAGYSNFVSGAGLELSNGIFAVTLDIIGNFANGGLQVTEAGGDTVITDVTCYAAGTRIATPGGDLEVEQLKIGDLVRTLHAGDRPVKWIGWRRYDGRFIRGNRAALPVCIKADAIADGVPERDLFVSPGHAIAIDNVLVHASRLVNGVSVVQAREVESVTYYHVELESHEILFAENCPAESFQDEQFRKQFFNADEYRRLYPGEVAPAVMRLPRLESGFELHAIWRHVAARAGIAEVTVTGPLRGYVDQTGPERCFGWAQDLAAPDTPVSLDIFSENRLIGQVLANLYRADVLAAGHGNGYQGFEFELPVGLSGQVEIRRTVNGVRLQLADGAARRAA